MSSEDVLAQTDTIPEELVKRVLEILIPGGHGMPSAVDVDVHSRWLVRALEVRPDLRPSLKVVISRFAESLSLGSDQALKGISLEDPENFARAAGLLAGAYFMADEVRGALNYPGQEARTLDDDLPDYIDLLERVVARGPIYRTMAD